MSRVRDQKKRERHEFETKKVGLISRPKKEKEEKKDQQKESGSSSRPKISKKERRVVLSSRPKKEDKTLTSRLKIPRKFRCNNGFVLFNITGNEIPQFCEYVYYKPELWKVISEISPGLYRVESCLSRTRKVSTLELLAPATIRSRTM